MQRRKIVSSAFVQFILMEFGTIKIGNWRLLEAKEPRNQDAKNQRINTKEPRFKEKIQKEEFKNQKKYRSKNSNSKYIKKISMNFRSSEAN